MSVIGEEDVSVTGSFPGEPLRSWQQHLDDLPFYPEYCNAPGTTPFSHIEIITGEILITVLEEMEGCIQEKHQSACVR
jgi:hypothetical protein